MSRTGRINARPRSQVETGAPTGLQPLNVGGERDSYLYVPTEYRHDRSAPLVLLLHGSGGHAHHGLGLLQHLADDAGLILVAPASSSYTWDVIVGEYGPDVALLDRTLEQVFGSYAVDPAHLAIGGFSDGASYALSLGVTNGDLFTHIIAFSPGFAAPAAQRDRPRIFVSHGTRDEVLPISACSRRVVPMLQRAGYPVDYHEFEGGHTIPAEIARTAVNWFVEASESA